MPERFKSNGDLRRFDRSVLMTLIYFKQLFVKNFLSHTVPCRAVFGIGASAYILILFCVFVHMLTDLTLFLALSIHRSPTVTLFVSLPIVPRYPSRFARACVRVCVCTVGLSLYLCQRSVHKHGVLGEYHQALRTCTMFVYTRVYTHLFLATCWLAQLPHFYAIMVSM